MTSQYDGPQRVQVAGRVVVEEGAIVEAEGPVRRELLTPEVERAQVGLEPGAGQQVCDDEAEGEPEGENRKDSADGVPRAGRP